VVVSSSVQLQPSDDPRGASGPSSLPIGPQADNGDDLPFRVEVWNAAKELVEQLVAVTASGSIGYAAFYAATKEYPQRYITLRHKTTILSRWNGPTH
jgi:hypothetical protein